MLLSTTFYLRFFGFRTQLFKLTSSLRDAMADFKFPVLASVWVSFTLERKQKKKRSYEKRTHVEVRALRSISAKDELQQGFQTKGIVKEQLDWFVEFSSRRMKTHHILIPSLLIPNTRFSIGSFSSFTLKDVTPFSEVKLLEGMEGNPLQQVRMREK